MWVITLRMLVEAAAVHPDAAPAIDRRYRRAKAARWANLHETRATFLDADEVSGLTVFDIGGNKYRLVARVSDRTHKVFLLEFLTHGEYDRWSAKRRGGK